MTHTKRTPGTYIVGYGVDSSGSRTFWVQHARNYKAIARIIDTGDKGQANAIFLAAAPKTKKCCDELLGLLRDIRRSLDRDDMSLMPFDRIDAALAEYDKAKEEGND